MNRILSLCFWVPVLVIFMGTVCSGQRAELLIQSGHSEEVLSVAFSPDGQLLASGGLDSTIKLWEVASGRELRTLGHSMSVTSVAFSPDGRTLASGSADKTIKLWSVASGKMLCTLQGHTGFVRSVTFSPDGQTLASGSDDQTIKLWDVATTKELVTLQGHADSIFSVAFSPDGQTLASRSADKTVKLWSVATGKELRTIRFGGADLDKRHLNFRFGSVVFSPDGRIVAAGNICQPVYGGLSFKCDDKVIKLWDVKTGGEVRTLQGHTVGAMAVAFSPDGQKLASGGGEGTVRLWDVASGKELSTLQDRSCEGCPLPTFAVNSVAFSPDGEVLASGGMEIGGIKLWEVSNRKELRTLHGSKLFVGDSFFSPQAQTLAEIMFGRSGTVTKLWTTTSGTPVRTLQGALHAFSSDGQTLAVRQKDEAPGPWHLSIVEASSGRELRKLQDEAGWVTRAISPDFEVLASVSDDEAAIKLQEVSSGKELQGLRGGANKVVSVAFSPDGRTLARVAHDGSITLWDLVRNSELRTLEGGTDGGISVVFTPEGGKLARRYGPTVKVWELASGKLLLTLQAQSYWSPSSIAFSPDGQMLAGGGRDKTIKLWDVANGKELVTLRSDSAIVSLAFSPDGKILASSESGKLKLWDVVKQTELCTLMVIEQSDWLVVTPDGLFDGSPAAWDRILWRFSENLYDVQPPEVFFNEFYYPGLLTEIFAGRRPHPAKDISQKDRRQPQLNLALAQGTPGNGRITTRNLTVSVRVAEAPADKEHRAGSGAQDVRLFRNGSLVKVWHGDAFALGEKEGCQKQGAGQVVCETAVPVIAGENRFTAYAFNHDNIKSSDGQLTITGAESLKRAGIAYIVAIGINEYGNSQFNLRYAAADARSFADELQRQQTSLKHFNQVKVISLLDKQATKANILDTMKTLAAQVQPEDAVIVYFAGHGTAERDSYYLIPHDLAYKGARTRIDQTGLNTILSHSLSDRELQQAFERIDTANLVLVLDTCNSGQALESAEKRRGPMNSKGLAQLAYEKGMYVLTAAESFQAAREASRLGHGLLTYALVEEGLKTSAADTERRDGQVDLREWLDYATQRVPRMQQEAMQQTRDLEHPLVFVEGEEKIKDPARRSLQQPRVFYRREPEAQPLIVARPRSSGVKQ